MMWKSVTTMQAKLPEQMGEEEAKEFFCKGFERKGYEVCDEESAEYSCWIKLHESGKWLSMGKRGLTSYSSIDESYRLANCLETYCVHISIVDSEDIVMAAVEPKNSENNAIAGGKNFPFEVPRGRYKEIWDSLFAAGKGIEDFHRIIQKDYVKIEEVLGEVAALFEMDGDSLRETYSCTKAYPEELGDVTVLHFKSTKERRKATLGRVFKEIFGEELKKRGFVKLKGRHPYFVRVVGGEILHFIAYRDDTCYIRGHKGFVIQGGAGSIYRKEYDLKESPRNNKNWLHDLYDYARKEADLSREELDKLFAFDYREDDIESLRASVSHALEKTLEYIMPVLDRAVDRKSCINYFDNYSRGDVIISSNKECKYSSDSEGFIMILHDTVEGKMEWKEELTFKNRIPNIYFENPEYHRFALEELERRKKKNTEYLRSFGLDI